MKKTRYEGNVRGLKIHDLKRRYGAWGDSRYKARTYWIDVESSGEDYFKSDFNLFHCVTVDFAMVMVMFI